MRNFEIMAAFEKVLKRLDVIDAKVSGMPQVQVQVSSRFLPTVTALSSLGSGTASQVSRVTGRSRAFESKNLNDLHSMGLLSKQGQGRMKIFSSRKVDAPKADF
ncbi:MAG: hypothetical protein NWF05_00425 [Candidatus Bathyarchaeota archaeon]|nr:hypothetical protein [Candidatus Bathyarchaeota archaeon]